MAFVEGGRVGDLMGDGVDIRGSGDGLRDHGGR